MILRSLHTTTYTYSEPVSVSHTEVHLAPRATARQTVIEHDLVIHPSPDFLTEREDYFGNQVARFSIHEPHQALRIIATAVVDLQIVEPPYPGLTPPWEQVRAEVRRHDAADSFAA
ncbi:MAG TPA: transglutaminase N-terminal domain-containing protein, partial [Candidatus Binataceae bacterium]|nr:transglutaminase N-terminal domain-containing protein [Candidatus Binataceae bacterium]